MSGVESSGGPTQPNDAGASEIPEEYSEAYQRAYRRSLAEHPTELMSPARPGKRASEQSPLAARRTKLAGAFADLLSDARGRMLVGAVVIVLLLVIAYEAGRLIA